MASVLTAPSPDRTVDPSTDPNARAQEAAQAHNVAARDLIRAVATVSAALANQPKDNVANQRLSFFIVAGGQDPLLSGIQESKDKLTAHQFPVVYREIAERGHQYLDGNTLQELIRWIDSLDRQ